MSPATSKSLNIEDHLVEQVSAADLESLLGREDDLAISIFSPMVEAGPQTQQNPIRFKNLVREVEEQLEARGMGTQDIQEKLAPLWDLVDDHDFWQHQGDGLAVFMAGDTLRLYRVPMVLEELAVVESRFHLQPLLPLLSGDGRFYILALSQKDVRLLEATRHRVRQLELGDEVPTSLADALGYELEEPQRQHHSGQGPSVVQRGAIHHGQGVGEDDVKPEILKFFQLVAKGIDDHIRDRQAPLVLMAVDYLHPIYHEANHYPNLLEEGAHGNPDDLSARQIHDQVWPKVETIFHKVVEEARERYGQMAAADQGSNRLEEVIFAAIDGRVDTLFVARGERRWGSIDLEGRSVTWSDDQAGEGVQDLLDRAAGATLRRSGTVFAVEADEMPTDEPVAAIYRY